MNLTVRFDTLKRANKFPWIMGILNVTPDSFSDGGEFILTERAVAHGLEMANQGADVLDIGAESTRPGAENVPAATQIQRLIPVIAAIRKENQSVVISVDTRLAAVAQAALSVGADIINDTSALRDDPELAGAISSAGATVILMHRKGTPQTMQQDGGPEYADVIGEISTFLRDRHEFAVSMGIRQGHILLDPGLGFGKRFEHNLEIIRRFDRFFELGLPVVFGASRKSFVGQLTGVTSPKDRDAGSLACAHYALQLADSKPSPPLVLRVHDVAATIQVVRVLQGIRNSQPSTFPAKR